MSGRFDDKVTTHFSLADKLREVEREIASRKKAYPRAVAKKRLAADEAARRIDLLRAIARDYRASMNGYPTQTRRVP